MLWTSTILGLWREIESDRLTLIDPSSWYSEGRPTVVTPSPAGVVIDDPPTIIDCYYGLSHFRLVDTLNYSRVPLQEMVGEIEPAAGLSRTFRHWVDTWVDHGFSGWGSTASGLSWESWKKLTLKHYVHVHCQEPVTQLERRSFRGGICEARRIGRIDEEVIGLDVKSFYPSIMQRLRVPTRLIEYYGGETEMPPDAIDRPDESIAEVHLKSDNVQYPVVQGGITWYATGDFWTCLAGPELRQAYQLSHVVGVGRAALYECTQLFGDWVDAIFRLRQQCEAADDKAGVALWKLVANSLYGRFSQRSPRWERGTPEISGPQWGQWVAYTDESECPEVWRSIAGISWRRVDQGESEDAMPAISSFVTSAGRTMLRDIIRLAGEREVLYCDTDGLLVTREGLNRLSVTEHMYGDGPGKLRVTGTWHIGDIYGLKHYRLGDVLTCGGLSEYAEEVNQHEYLQQRRMRAASILADGPRDNIATWLEAFREDLCHPRGVVGADGWVTPRYIRDSSRVDFAAKKEV
jgi:hypothetical protein